jgi:hypothetical protein
LLNPLEKRFATADHKFFWHFWCVESNNAFTFPLTISFPEQFTTVTPFALHFVRPGFDLVIEKALHKIGSGEHRFWNPSHRQ